MSDPAGAADPRNQAAIGTSLNADVPATDTMGTLESPVAPERDSRGVSYIFNLIGMYLVFFVSLAIIAWFGIFSEV